MKTFILSLGVQRSGTTWIWELLKHIPEANMGNKKEHHYWYKKDKHKWNNEDYIHYFDNLLDGEEHITGDITPIYGLCNKKQLQEAKDIIEDPSGVFSHYFLYLNTVSKLVSQPEGDILFVTFIT